ncbi:MAG: hypothetical protein IKH46_04080 [Lachnospiraceae bacterium]|nr:hypothetical protein [Lachnospiraceae bacterium]
MQKRKETTTSHLDELLEHSGAEVLGTFLKKEPVLNADSDNLFGDYVKKVIREKNLTQKQVFLGAGIDEKVGYKYLAGDKHTSNRDVIIRICLGAHMSLKESERALKLYGMSPLYARIDRDAALIIAFNRRIYEIGDVNEILEKYDLEPLYESKGTEDA